MNEYKCKCGNSTNFFAERKENQCGLYCGLCGKWQKWLTKDEERLFNHKYRNKTNNSIMEFVKFIDKHTHVSGNEICLDDDITILAEEFLKGEEK